MKLLDALRQRLGDWRHERTMARLHRELSRLIKSNDKRAAQAWGVIARLMPSAVQRRSHEWKGGRGFEQLCKARLRNR